MGGFTCSCYWKGIQFHVRSRRNSFWTKAYLKEHPLRPNPRTDLCQSCFGPVTHWTTAGPKHLFDTEVIINWEYSTPGGKQFVTHGLEGRTSELLPIAVNTEWHCPGPSSLCLCPSRCVKWSSEKGKTQMIQKVKKKKRNKTNGSHWSVRSGKPAMD